MSERRRNGKDWKGEEAEGESGQPFGAVTVMSLGAPLLDSP